MQCTLECSLATLYKQSAGKDSRDGAVLRHSNDFGSLQLCSQVAIRVLALLFAFQHVT
jgi:hypothetical protein